MKPKVSPLEIRQIMRARKKIVRPELAVRYRNLKTGRFVKGEITQ